MTDAKVLADALVEAGIGGKANSPYHYYIGAAGLFDADEFITDWRVAGKVLESAHMAFIEKHGRWQVRYDKAYGDRTREWYSSESLPRAIIEAWYEARQ